MRDALTMCEETTNVFVSVLETVFNKAECALNKVNTLLKAKNCIVKHSLFMSPEAVPLSYRRENQ